MLKHTLSPNSNLESSVEAACHHNKRKVHRNVECRKGKIHDNVKDYWLLKKYTGISWWNAGSALKSHVSDLGDTSTTFLHWFCSGRRWPIQKRTQLTEKTPVIFACVKVWVQQYWHRCWFMSSALCWSRGCSVVENSWIGFHAQTNWPRWFQTAPSSAQWVIVLLTSLDFMSRLETQTKWSEKEDHSTHGDFWCMDYILCVWIQDVPYRFSP